MTDIESYHSCDGPLDWHGLYNSKFKEYVTPEANAHPAKMSLALADKIFTHLERLQLIHKGDMIIDFMAGTARTGIIAELRGYKFTGIELESHFIDMISKNKALLADKLRREPQWNIIHGDARHLSELLNGGSAIVSPPYSQAQDRARLPVQDGSVSDVMARQYDKSIHGSSSAQIGNLPDKVGIVSPPYMDQLPANNKFKVPNDTSGHFSGKDYGSSKNQIGNQSNETYLSAMLQVYAEAYKAGISPLVTVTKNPTRKGHLRRLDLDTASLLQQAGYRIVDYHRAILFRQNAQQTLLGDIRKEVKGQVSFFKRISMLKGNIAADHEDIIFAVKKSDD